MSGWRHRKTCGGAEAKAGMVSTAPVGVPSGPRQAGRQAGNPPCPLTWPSARHLASSRAWGRCRAHAPVLPRCQICCAACPCPSSASCVAAMVLHWLHRKQWYGMYRYPCAGHAPINPCWYRVKVGQGIETGGIVDQGDGLVRSTLKSSMPTFRRSEILGRCTQF